MLQGIETPVGADKDSLIQLILGHQARVLTERAQKAIRQLCPSRQEDVADIASVDPRSLEPPTTAYSWRGARLEGAESTAGATAAPTTGSGGRGGGGEMVDIRSRVRQQIQLRKVCVCVCLSAYVCEVCMYVFHYSVCGSRAHTHTHQQSTEVLDTSSINTVEELRDESQIDLLSVRQLKTILRRNCIDYHGCVEKSELIERVHRLYQEKLDQKGGSVFAHRGSGVYILCLSLQR